MMICSAKPYNQRLTTLHTHQWPTPVQRRHHRYAQEGFVVPAGLTLVRNVPVTLVFQKRYFLRYFRLQIVADKTQERCAILKYVLQRLKSAVQF